MGSPHNTTCNKVTYKSRKRALDALVHIQATKTVADFPAGKMPVREYRCEFCTKWHLTSKPRKKGYKSAVQKMQAIAGKATEGDYLTEQLSKHKRYRPR